MNNGLRIIGLYCALSPYRVVRPLLDVKSLKSLDFMIYQVVHNLCALLSGTEQKGVEVE
jgi:hypothetical protein